MEISYTQSEGHFTGTGWILVNLTVFVQFCWLCNDKYDGVMTWKEVAMAYINYLSLSIWIAVISVMTQKWYVVTNVLEECGASFFRVK